MLKPNELQSACIIRRIERRFSGGKKAAKFRKNTTKDGKTGKKNRLDAQNRRICIDKSIGFCYINLALG